METTNETRDRLRARIAQLEQKLQSNIPTTSNRNTGLGNDIPPIGVGVKRIHSVREQAATKRVKQTESSNTKWSAYDTATKQKLVSTLVKKNFKWTAATPSQSVGGVVPVSTMKSPTAIPIIPINTATVVAGSHHSGSTGSLSAPSSSSKTDSAKIEDLLSKIKNINKVAAINNARNDNSGRTNKKNTTWTSSDAIQNSKVKVARAKSKDQELNNKKNNNKWTNSSVLTEIGMNDKISSPSTTVPALLPISNINKNTVNKNLNIQRRNSSGKMNTVTIGKTKSQISGKKTWAKKDDDFTLVRIEKDRTCLFFNKMGKCRRGSKWYVHQDYCYFEC